MCGIAGAVALREDVRPSPEIVRALTQALAHRGPNGQGVWISPSGRACLGHRRLSVIDLATGQQPMVSVDGSQGLVFNGEIYNYLELRRTLEEKGETFRTASDTEVLHILLQREGVDALSSLRGMFAFVAWDDRSGRLIMARDRIGKKPLYYRIDGGILYFASSLSALRRTVPGGWDIDPASVDDYLSLGYIPSPATIYRDVFKLPAAHRAVNRGDALDIVRFWDLAPLAQPFVGSYEDAVAELESTLRTAVRLRLRSDVPLGVYLSGGIDSSLVTALAAEETTAPLETFSIGFDHGAFDESGQASAFSTRLGLRHHTFQADSSISDALPELTTHFGEPNADWSALPMWLLARETSRHVTVALGGDGGDEGFAGYAWYQNATRLARYSSLLPGALVGLLSGALQQAGPADGVLGQAQRALHTLAAADDASRFAMLRLLIGDLKKKQLYTPEFKASLAGKRPATAALAEAYRQAEGSALRRMRYADQQFYLAEDLMPKVDVTSMAFGLEVRAPLLDQDVFAFGLSLPDDFLVNEGGGKRILRDLLARLVPGLAQSGPKRGFSPPAAQWMHKELRPQILALPSSRIVRSTGWLRAGGVSEMVDSHLAGKRDHGARLYALLMLEEWLQQEQAGGREAPPQRLAAAD